jgi:hypothetical protein
MKSAMVGVIFLCSLSAPVCFAQNTLEGQIQSTNEAFEKYGATHSVVDLNRVFKSLVVIRMSNDKVDELYLGEVTDLWIELFRAVDDACDPTFDPAQKPVLMDTPRAPNRTESTKEIANDELLRKSNHYWSLNALDLNATGGFKLFVEYHYRTPEALEKLRHTASQQGLSPERIDHLLEQQTSSH